MDPGGVHRGDTVHYVEYPKYESDPPARITHAKVEAILYPGTTHEKVVIHKLVNGEVENRMIPHELYFLSRAECLGWARLNLFTRLRQLQSEARSLGLNLK